MSANSPAYPPYERMRTGLCLAAVGGFLEAYTYTLKGGVFANAQTGNLVLFALRLTPGPVGPPPSRPPPPSPRSSSASS